MQVKQHMFVSYSLTNIFNWELVSTHQSKEKKRKENQPNKKPSYSNYKILYKFEELKETQINIRNSKQKIYKIEAIKPNTRSYINQTQRIMVRNVKSNILNSEFDLIH